MTYLFALLAGLAGAAAGFLLAAAIGCGLAIAFRMSSFEGAAGYFVVWVAGPVGAIAGLILGMYLVLRFHGGFTGFAAIAGRMALIVFAIGALTAGGILVRLATVDPFLNKAKPHLLFELRVPSDLPPAKIAATRVELQSSDQTTEAYFSGEPVRSGDRLTRRGGVEIPGRASGRMLILRIPGEPDRVFRLAIKPAPDHSDALGPWQRADLVFPEGAETARPAPAADPYDIRYRVRNPQVEFARPVVEFELDLPASTRLPDNYEAVRVTARFDDNAERGILHKESWRRIEGNRAILHGIAQMAGPAGSTVEVAIPNGPVLMFDVAVNPPASWPWSLLERREPMRADTFGEWRSIDRIQRPGGGEVRPASVEDDAKVRYFER